MAINLIRRDGRRLWMNETKRDLIYSSFQRAPRFALVSYSTRSFIFGTRAHFGRKQLPFIQTKDCQLEVESGPVPGTDVCIMTGAPVSWHSNSRHPLWSRAGCMTCSSTCSGHRRSASKDWIKSGMVNEHPPAVDAITGLLVPRIACVT